MSTTERTISIDTLNMFESLNFFVPKFSKFLLVSGVTFERAKRHPITRFSIEPTPTPTHRLNANEREREEEEEEEQSVVVVVVVVRGFFFFFRLSLSLSLDRVSKLGEIQKKKKKRDF